MAEPVVGDTSNAGKGKTGRSRQRAVGNYLSDMHRGTQQFGYLERDSQTSHLYRMRPPRLALVPPRWLFAAATAAATVAACGSAIWGDALHAQPVKAPGPPQAPSQPPVPFGYRQMVGFVRDATGVPLDGVTVEVHGRRSTTDARGAFALLTSAVDTASITLRRVGFEPLDAFLRTRNGSWDTVVVQMDLTVTTLRSVDVNENFATRASAIRGFNERQERGLGQFVLRDEIVDRGSQKLTDVLRSRKGVMIVRGRLRFASSIGSRGASCQPNVFLDGARVYGMEVDELPAQAIEAVELYPNMSTIPIEFQTIGRNTAPCGTIVIWTRTPNSKGR